MFTRTLVSILSCPLMAIVLLQWGCAAPQHASLPNDGVFVHIRSGLEHPHSVLMGLRMAQLMSPERDVLVYFDVDGIEVVMEGAPDLQMEPFGASRALIQDLLEHQVQLYACPGCLQATGKTPEQLMPGIRVADAEAFFAFTQGRILTLDY